MHNSCEERPHHPGPDRAAAGAPQHHLRHRRAARPHELLQHGRGDDEDYQVLQYLNFSQNI